jgi:hypothetical protein
LDARRCDMIGKSKLTKTEMGTKLTNIVAKGFVLVSKLCGNRIVAIARTYEYESSHEDIIADENLKPSKARATRACVS